MAVKKQEVQEKDHNQIVVERAKDFWTRYSKPVMIVAVVVILVAGGYIGYKKFYKAPREAKAVDALFQAEVYYRNSLMTSNADSLVKLALNGDGVNPGFLKVIKQYGGTDAAERANLYAGDCYLTLNDNVNAVKYLKKFSTGSKIMQARAYKLLGDAYADQGKNSDALDYYKKAAKHFKEDDENSPEYYFLAAYFAEKVMNDKKQAIELYKELKEKYPQTRRGFEADKYLARLGVLSSE
jgi:tetratricopeptide (TPR) repeat protein